MGKPVEPGVYKVSLRAVADKEDELSAKAFPVVYGFDGGSGGLAGSNQSVLQTAGVGDKRHIIGYSENCQMMGYMWLKS